ncbi:PaaI family thioesterase [Chelatococcus reniformis]|uniref:Phenylacetic acid degradation protein n=1 Tax=Chelatococcus reniformis TaxID=1494448 RepID=A0A916XE42_9HYPH|nr:PaaI family thioesterase [Chelatococcus reniformis]GGC66895.1 phenylacetic acid degradation protein [Chelatococcus reniformis]
MTNRQMRETDAAEALLDSIPMPPSAQLLGWHIVAADPTRGWIRIGFDGKRAFLNPAGLIQGGLQTAMLDDTMGPAVWIRTGGELYTATIDMHVSFLAPARPGQLFGEGQVVQLGRTIAFMEARLLDGDGHVLARANASARLMHAARALG